MELGYLLNFVEALIKESDSPTARRELRVP